MGSDQRSLFIVNPVAAGGKTARIWPQIEKELALLDLSFDFIFTEAPLHATTLAKEGVEQGFENIVAVGGDGTVNEVVNGLMSPGGQRAEAALGVVITGRGSDLARTIGVPADYSEACARLADQRTMTVDLGLVEFDQEGERKQRYFVNVGGSGFDAEVAHRANRAPNSNHSQCCTPWKSLGNSTHCLAILTHNQRSRNASCFNFKTGLTR